LRLVTGASRPAHRWAFLLCALLALVSPLAALAQTSQAAPVQSAPTQEPTAPVPPATVPDATRGGAPPPPASAAPETPVPPPAAPPASSSAPPAGQYVVRPVRLSSAPVIDGKLDDAVWREAAKLGSFTQINPTEGAPASEPTEVFLGYDENNLYIGARCYDDEPRKVFATGLTRDAEIIYDDYLQVVFDTFRDGRSGFLFATNAAGVKVDGLVRNEGEELNYNWDAVWTVRSTRDSGGWSVEMAIPWRSLRFPNRSEQDWGFNVERFVSRKQEQSDWKPMKRDYGFYASYKVSQYGELVGLEGARQGSRFHFSPYLLARAQEPQNDGSRSTIGRVGGDVKVNVTSDLVADLTYHTDFSETEADEANVNLSRSPLLIPEKRAFFLEGASLFYVGDRPEPQHPSDENFLFFSRQIGITPDGRAQIPILGGVKLTGHQGDYDIGALSLQTEAVRGPDGYGGRIDEPRTTYSVLRLKREVGDSSSFGVMGISKDAAGDQNRVGALDWDVSLTPNLRNGGYLAKSSTPGVSGDDWNGSTDFYWDSRNLRFHYVYTDIGRNFNDEVGYIQRLGVRQYRADNNVILWPERGPFRQAWFTYNLDYIADRDTSQIQTRINNLQANAYFRNAAGISGKLYDDLEVLTVPLEIKRGLFIPAGSYHFGNYFVGFQTDYTKPLGGAGRLAWGDYYDGHFLQYFYFVSYRPLPGLFVDGIYQETKVDLREGSFTTDILLGEANYSFSPELSVRTWVQWTRGANLESKLILDWEFRPDSRLYVVYQDLKTYVDFFDPRQPVFGTPGRSLTVKTVFLF
jgi:Domain of unknown function (DUF5916)/Carbohydrate family 9 binding domain-like